MVDDVTLKPIGIIHSPFHELKGMPIQPKGAADTLGTLELFEEYADGLKDLDGFSHIYVIFHLHQAGPSRLMVTPFMDTVERGVFATRSPSRPNPIGLSVVELVAVDGCRLTVRGIDILDGTPLLDIKPYIEKFDHPAQSRAGWMQASETEIRQKRSDERFI